MKPETQKNQIEVQRQSKDGKWALKRITSAGFAANKFLIVLKKDGQTLYDPKNKAHQHLTMNDLKLTKIHKRATERKMTKIADNSVTSISSTQTMPQENPWESHFLIISKEDGEIYKFETLKNQKRVPHEDFYELVANPLLNVDYVNILQDVAKYMENPQSDNDQEDFKKVTLNVNGAL